MGNFKKIRMVFKNWFCRGYFRLKLSPTSGSCRWWLIFFKNLFYQNNCKDAMNIGGGQIRGALFNFFVVKKCPFCIFRTLPSVSKIRPVMRLRATKDKRKTDTKKAEWSFSWSSLNLLSLRQRLTSVTKSLLNLCHAYVFLMVSGD